MSKVKDLCDWWTRERIEEEEAVWQRDQFFVQYANDVRDFMRKHKLKSVTELGCGSGHVARELANEFSYRGYDGSKLMIEFAQEIHPGFLFKTLDIRLLPIPRIKSDLVCSFAVLKHFSLQDWKEILTKMLSAGKYGMIQVQLRVRGFESIEDGFFGDEVRHSWINIDEMCQAVVDAGHEVLELRISEKDVSPYMSFAAEALLITKETK